MNHAFINAPLTKRREHAPREKLLSLQVLRGVAASFVVVHHVALAHMSYGGGASWITRSGLGQLGACGVDLFFVISGFIMMYTSGTERGPMAAKAFLVRRAQRIFPLYWTWTTLLLVLWKMKLLFTHTQYSNLYILNSYILWPLPHGATFHPILDPGWTLTLEIFFYLVFSVTILFNSRSSLGILVICGLFSSLLLGHLFPSASSLHYVLANSLLMEFGLGILAAYLLQTIQARKLSSLRRWLLVAALLSTGIAALLLSAHFGQPQHLRFLVWGLPCFLILLGTALLRLPHTATSFIYLGDASYSIYLGHFLMVVVYATAVKKQLLPGWLPADTAILLVSAAIIALSSLGFGLIEQPQLRWLSGRQIFSAKLIPASPFPSKQ